MITQCEIYINLNYNNMYKNLLAVFIFMITPFFAGKLHNARDLYTHFVRQRSDFVNITAIFLAICYSCNECEGITTCLGAIKKISKIAVNNPEIKISTLNLVYIIIKTRF